MFRYLNRACGIRCMSLALSAENMERGGEIEDFLLRRCQFLLSWFPYEKYVKNNHEQQLTITYIKHQAINQIWRSFAFKCRVAALHTAGVTGSNPVSPTNSMRHDSSNLFICCGVSLAAHALALQGFLHSSAQQKSAAKSASTDGRIAFRPSWSVKNSSRSSRN